MVENCSGNALKDRRLRLLEEAGAGTIDRLRGGPSTLSVISQPVTEKRKRTKDMGGRLKRLGWPTSL